MDEITNIYIEENYQQFMHLRRDKFNVITNFNDFCVDSCVLDDSIFIKTNTNSRRIHLIDMQKNVIDMSRVHDLVSFRKLQNSGFNVPGHIHSVNNNRYYSLMKPNTEYLLKPFNSARSIGQMFVNNETINSVIEDAYKIDWEEFNKKYEIDTSTSNNDNERKHCHYSINCSEFYLSEVEEFTDEYRVLYFKGIESCKYIVEKRDGYQVNSEQKREHFVCSRKTQQMIEICRKIKQFGDKQSSPMLSFDIYIKTPSLYGVFEICTQFGVIYPGHNTELEYQMTYAMELKISEITADKNIS